MSPFCCTPAYTLSTPSICSSIFLSCCIVCCSDQLPLMSLILYHKCPTDETNSKGIIESCTWFHMGSVFSSAWLYETVNCLVFFKWLKQNLHMATTYHWWFSLLKRRVQVLNLSTLLRNAIPFFSPICALYLCNDEESNTKFTTMA